VMSSTTSFWNPKIALLFIGISTKWIPQWSRFKEKSPAPGSIL
jgi:hypothetical protein